MKRRPSHYDRPHDVYVLADPRTGEIRYIGRTVRGVATRFRLHLDEARTRSYPLHRWIERLRKHGLKPIPVVVARGVPHDYETELCEALVARGVHLLNVTPSYARVCGRIVLDVEREGKRVVGDLVHLDLAVALRRAPEDDPDEVVDAAAAKAFRRMADILDPPPGSRRASQYEEEIAQFLAARLVHVVSQGKPWRHPLSFADVGGRLHAAAKRAIRLACAATRGHKS